MYRPIEFSIEKIYVKVPLSESDWNTMNALGDVDSDGFEEVSKAIDPHGAFDIDYSGHFGSNLYFGCRTHAEVAGIIKAFYELLDGET